MLLGAVSFVALIALETALADENTKIHEALIRPRDPAVVTSQYSRVLDRPIGPMIRVVVETRNSDDVSYVLKSIEALDGRVEIYVGTKVQAQIPRDALKPLASMPEVLYIRPPLSPIVSQGSIISEGQAITGADLWHEAGFKGQGVKVAILDSGFLGYQRLLGRELPPEEKVITRSFRADGDIECRECDNTSQRHGLAVAEIVHDMAPEATLYLVNFNTDVEMEAAVQWLIEEGVDVINTSFGFLTTGCPYEGTGFLEPIFEEARESGIFWAASAGNDGKQHWAGTFEDPDGDNVHNFLSEDESQTLRNLEEGDRIVAFLWWDDPCRRTPNDYDLVLEDEEGNEIERSFRAGPRNSWPLEALIADIPKDGTYELKIERTRGNKANRLSLLLSSGARPQYIVPEGSAGLTEPEMSRFVISVGATDLRNRLEPFSSQGPTPDGRIKPDLVAPDGVITRTFRPTFSGTSASSPHVAGAAALVKSAFPNFGPDEIQAFLEERAEDLGPPGKDGQFGAGLLTLGPPPTEQPQPPAAPSALVAIAVGPTQIDLSWQDHSEDEEGFIVERRLGTQGAFEEVARTEPDVTTFSDTTVAPETTYCYQVRAFNAAGTSEPSNEACVTTPAENRPPIADAGPDQTVFVGDVVQLDGSRSSDPDGDPLSFHWAFVVKPQTSATKLSDPSSPTPTFVADFPGVYVIELTVDDGRGGTAKDTVTVTAKERPPVRGQLIALKFIRIEFSPVAAWERSLEQGCVVYRNVSEKLAMVRLALPDGSVVKYEIPLDGEVIVCGDVAHIDARIRPKATVWNRLSPG